MRYIFFSVLFLCTSCTSISSVPSNTQEISNSGQILSGSVSWKSDIVTAPSNTNISSLPLALTWSTKSCTDIVKNEISQKDFEYNYLVHIEDDSWSQKDWAIVNMLTSHRCDLKWDLELSQKDAQICQYYVSDNLDGLLQKIPDTPKEDIRLMQSLISGINQCLPNDEPCTLYLDLVNGIKNRNYSFPTDVSDPKIKFFAYKKLFPYRYDDALNTLLLQRCETNQK